MTNADLLFSTQTEILGDYYIAKPETGPFLCRLRDAIAILTGRAVAVSFTEKPDVKQLIKDKIIHIAELQSEFNDKISNFTEEESVIIIKRLQKMLKSLNTTYDLNNVEEVSIGNYTFKNSDGLIVLEADEDLHLTYNKLVEIYKNTKFKFTYDKIVNVYNEVDKTIKAVRGEDVE